MRRRSLLTAFAATACLALPAVGIAHDFDHPAPGFAPTGPPSPEFMSGGIEGTEWEMIATIPTGNLQSDLDFFTQKGETFASVGTLGAGANSAGQTIVQLTDKGEVKPEFFSSHPSATCVQNEAAALSLQHDVEATPKGDAIFSSVNPKADRRDTQLLIDATDANGRCHDSAFFGGDGLGLVPLDRQGGLEIIDVTDLENPVEIGLTSHIGESHTVNVDPKRPHIAYSVSSDFVSVRSQTSNPPENRGKRNNEVQDGNLSLDGFEVVDMSSCMDFLPGTSVEDKRAACKPEVYRYRYPEKELNVGFLGNARGVYGCHETEIYPDDTLTCGGGNAAMVFDFADAFDDNGTPNDFTDDTPRGTPLDCRLRDSVSRPGFRTGAKITDCVEGGEDGSKDLSVKGWLADGAPSLEGVEHKGSAYHQGRNGIEDQPSTFDSTEDIDFNHETELTTSGKHILSTDERGGGVLPGGASCSPGADIAEGNGGIHAHRVDRLQSKGAGDRDPDGAFDPNVAFDAYAKTPDGGKAIFRVPIRTQPQGSTCTAHVFQQIPGQNRIFMGWYSQGTQVVDYVENPDGTIEFTNSGFFIPANANTWVSHVFKVEKEADGRFTYFGATGDFAAGAGRNAIDIYKVTMPAPPTAQSPFGSAPDFPAATEPAGGGGGSAQPAATPTRPAPTPEPTPVACQSRAGFISASARGRGRNRGVGFDFRRRVDQPVTVDIFQQSEGRRITGERRVRRFENRTGAFTWDGKDKRGRTVPDGFYFARLRVEAPGGQADTVRITLGRSKGRFGPRRSFFRRDSCGALKTFKLSRPVFGGSRTRPLGISYRLNTAARVQVTVTNRRERVIRRFAAKQVAAGRTQRLTLPARRLAKGDYRVKISVTSGGRTTTSTLTANRL